MDSLETLLPKLCCPECGPVSGLARAGDMLVCERDPEHRFFLYAGVPVLFDRETSAQFIERAQRARGKNGARRGRNVGGEYHWSEYSMEEFLPKIAGGDVLLVGCGDAGEKPHLDRLGFHTVGFDVSVGSAADFLADVHRMPVRDNTFDVVLSMQVLEHLTEPWIAVEQIARVLRPGGWFVGSVAFLKPYHTSYYHMTHFALLHLFQSRGLRVTKLAGAQSVAFSILSEMLPLGSAAFRRSFWGTLERWLMKARVKSWSLRTGLDPDELTDRFHAGMPMSARTFDKLRFAPAVVFAAQKTDTGVEVHYPRPS